MRTGLAGVAAWLIMAGAAPAWSHAILVQSSPAVGATVPAGDVALRLRFNSRIDRARSRLTLIRADHSTEVLAIDAVGADDILTSKVTLPEGTSVVRWQVLAIDGHITRGDIPLIAAAKK